MNARKTVAILGAIMLATSAQAGTVGIDLVSLHIASSGMNNVNPGLSYRTDSGATIGAYYDSHRRVSAYAGWTFENGPAALTVGVLAGHGHTTERDTTSVEFRTVNVTQHKSMLLLTPSMALGRGFRVALIGEALHLMWEVRR